MRERGKFINFAVNNNEKNEYKKNMAELIITGRIIQKLDLQSGTSKAGNPWRKQEYVLETTDNYPKQICFNFFGDRIDQNPLNIGDMVNVHIDIQSREWNGRWYTDISGWKAEKVQPEGAANVGQPEPMPAPTGSFGQPDLNVGSEQDDLPF